MATKHVCASCGKKITWNDNRKYWEHVGIRPRHIAVPEKSTFERLHEEGVNILAEQLARKIEDIVLERIINESREKEK